MLGFDFPIIEVVMFLWCCITHWFLLFFSSLPAMTNEEFCCRPFMEWRLELV